MALGTIPNPLRAGDSLSWVESSDDYAPADGWDLRYVLIGQGLRLTLLSGADGESHGFAVEPEITSALAAGRYAWTEHAHHSDGRRVTLATGSVEILADPATVDPATLTHARRMLAAIESIVESRASQGELDLVATAFSGHQAQYSLADLRALHRQYAAQASAEDERARLAAGQRSGRFVRTRFGRVGC